MATFVHLEMADLDVSIVKFELPMLLDRVELFVEYCNQHLLGSVTFQMDAS